MNKRGAKKNALKPHLSEYWVIPPQANAQVLQELADVHFAKADKIVLVQDNLNTHAKASLYEAFAPAEARRLVERFEWHYTPKHGSWLNLAESELGVLSSQCLARRIADRTTLEREVAAWNARRNAQNAKADWHFTAADARVKLKSLYPSLSSVVRSAMRRARHWQLSTPSSDSARFSQLPCLGVKCHSNRSTRRRASAGSNAS